jgi:phosphoribosylcarboxyaminoimidazole (NCAIR) mutase
MADDRLESASDKAKLLVEQLEKQARLQSEINSSLDSYIEHVEKVRDLKKNINTYEKNIKKYQEEIDALGESTLDSDVERREVLRQTLVLLNNEVASLKRKHDLTVQAVKEAKKWSMLTAEAVVGTAKMLGNLSKIPGKLQGLMDPLKDLFEMDKAIRKASLQMGLIGTQSQAFRNNIKLAAEDTQKLGMGIKELAEMQAQYSENIGRNVSLGKEGLVALAQIAEGTALGAEATGQMAADFEAQGISAVRTKDAMEEAANRASSMGLNSAKVIKNIAQNTKMLNKFRFKDGVKGLVKMAELSAKLGVDMDFASGFAEKLWNVEGAVETAAQFNVMGGAFARLGDPFKLMYMARNDIAGLTEEIANAAAESATFNKQTGKFELGAMEMHRLKIIAEQTGLEYDKLVTAGQNAAKFTKIKSQVSFSMNDEAREFLANTAQLDEQGRAYITVDGEKKFLSMLGASGAATIQRQIDEKKSLEKRALEAKSFDEQITNLINMVKTFMLPIVEGLTNVLKPLVEKFMNDDKLKKDLKLLGENIGKLVEWGATKLKWFTETIIDVFGVNGIFAAWATGKGLMVLFDIAKWFANGISLSRGFLLGTRGMGAMGAGAGGAGAGGAGAGAGGAGAGSTAAGRAGTAFKGSLRSGGTMAGGALAAGFTGYGEYNEQRDKGKSKGEAACRAALKGAGAGGGAMAGMAAGAAIGAAFGGVGAIPGALLGLALGSLGAYAGGELADLDNYGVKDGLFKGSSSMKNRRAILQNGKITPIDKKDDLLALKKYGLAANSMRESGFSNNMSNKIEFGELRITGEIRVKMPDGTNIGQELIKSSEFRTSITRVITSQLDKNNNGGKLKP